MSPFSSVVTVSRASAMRSSSRLGSTSRRSLIFAVVTLTGQCSTGSGKSLPRPWPFARAIDEDVRVPELHAGAPLGGLDERPVDRQRAGLIEAAAVDPLPGRREAVHVSAHQLRDDPLAHQIPSGPKSSSGGDDGSSASNGAAAGGASFRLSSRGAGHPRSGPSPFIPLIRFRGTIARPLPFLNPVEGTWPSTSSQTPTP